MDRLVARGTFTSAMRCADLAIVFWNLAWPRIYTGIATCGAADGVVPYCSIITWINEHANLRAANEREALVDNHPF